jgi:type VII secretion protein EccB
MATKKDLTEAYAFSRRRLVTAFVSGAPGGREVEPARPGRTIVGGLALAVLLIAGAAVAGVFSPRVPEGWADQPGLIVSEESGAAYVITETAEGEDPVLRPVINITSARLILGADATPTIIPDEYINRERRGDDIGILGAPANVPDPERLIPDGWTACTTAASGIRLNLTAEPPVDQVTGGGLVVEVADDGDPAVYVIAEGRQEGSEEPRAYSYRLPKSKGRDNLLGLLGLPEAVSATPVPEEWLALFPEGGDLTRDSFGLTGVGRPATYARGEAGLESAEVGDVVTTPQERLLLTEDGPALLDEFAHAVYTNTGDYTPYEVDVAPELQREPPPYVPAHWPEEGLTPVLGELCVQLATEPGSRPVVRLVANPEDEAVSELVPRPRRSVTVDEGAGAYVLSGGFEQAAGGEPQLIDPKGLRYPLVGPDAAGQLGYADYPVATVPDSWIELVPFRVALSKEAALCPPTLEQGEPCA